MATSYQSELELELEEELGGLGEFENPEGEEEWEQGEGAHELEHHELAHELEADQFFGRIKRLVSRLPLRKIASFAAPLVATAIGGPVGGALGRVATQALGEDEAAMHEWEQPGAYEFEEELGAQEWELGGTQEFEDELAHEWEYHEQAHEFEHQESSQEVAHEISYHEIAHHEALAEMMAEAASLEHNAAQAEAMMGAAVMTALSPRDRRALQTLLPNLVRGAALLTNILTRRGHRKTRHAVRTVPTIMRRTVRTLKRQAAAGRPITRRAAGRAAAIEVRRVLGNPSACAAAIRQNVRATRRMRTRHAAR